MNIPSQTKSHNVKDNIQDDEENPSFHENAANNLEQLKSARDREVCAKSISGILLILLKWSKSSRMKYNEYLQIKIISYLITNLKF